MYERKKIHYEKESVGDVSMIKHMVALCIMSIRLNAKEELYNAVAYISPQCYTKTKDASKEIHNPCMSCHTNSKRPNYINDWELQEVYAFNQSSKKNHFSNLFKDRTAQVHAISDKAILNYIRQNNYLNKEHEIRLAKTLPPTWQGYRPDCYFHFDSEGFDTNPQGHFTGWRAFSYYPFLGTFFPTNGSTDDVLIRLPKAFQEHKGVFDKSTYKVNLAIVEAMIKESNIPIDEVNESVWGVDLNKDGKLDMSQQIIYKWAPLNGKKMHYVGDAQHLEKKGQLQIAAGLYPEGTEFLHTVRYIDVNETTQTIQLSARMKELRYAKKYGWNSYATLHNAMLSELKERHDFPERIKTFLGNSEEGLDNGYGWKYQGFIEDSKGDLRPQSYEETLYCMGCHSGIGATTDGTFAFARKFGWKHWSGLKEGFKNIKEPILADGRYEYSLYLQHNYAADEFRENREVIEKFFDNNGTIKESALQKLHNDIAHLILPSTKRAIELNKAYRVIVDEQSYMYGRDAHVVPVQNVHKEVEVNQKTGLKAITIERYPLKTTLPSNE